MVRWKLPMEQSTRAMNIVSSKACVEEGHDHHLPTANAPRFPPYPAVLISRPGHLVSLRSHSWFCFHSSGFRTVVRARISSPIWSVHHPTSSVISYSSPSSIRRQNVVYKFHPPFQSSHRARWLPEQGNPPESASVAPGRESSHSILSSVHRFYSVQIRTPLPARAAVLAQTLQEGFARTAQTRAVARQSWPRCYAPRQSFLLLRY